MPSCIISTSDRVPRLRSCLLLLCLFIALGAGAQTVTVRSIEISGNKKTRTFIIRRELTFSEGDTLLQAELGQVMERNRNNLINLGIFNQAVVNVSEWDTKNHVIDVTVAVQESWYIYAAPIFDLADRNFNVWWNTYDAALNRVNLGGRLDWLNFSGRNDKLKAKLQFGYTPKQEFEYRFPFLDRRQRFGLTTGFFHSSNKEAAYGTVANREQFVRIDERKMMERYRGAVRLVYRPSILLRHEMDVVYQHVKADSQFVADYNPNLFRNGGTTHEAVTLRYVFEYDNRNIKIFAEKGIRVLLETEKVGFGQQADENLFKSNALFEGNVTTGRRFQHRFTLSGKYSWIRSRPSYMHYQALGYGQNYIRGYELYLVDGLDFVLGKYQFALKLFDEKITLGEWIPMTAFREMPFRVFLSLHAETGYVNDPYTGDVNPLANRMLSGGGLGVQVLLYHNMLFDFNYSGNHLGEWGFFIHNRTNF